MRAPLAGELVIFARALMAHPAEKRGMMAKEILAETEAAHDYIRHNGTIHPALGDGSLMARILPLSPCSEPFADDLDFLNALAIVIEELVLHFRR